MRVIQCNFHWLVIGRLIKWTMCARHVGSLTCGPQSPQCGGQTFTSNTVSLLKYSSLCFNGNEPSPRDYITSFLFCYLYLHDDQLMLLACDTLIRSQPLMLAQTNFKAKLNNRRTGKWIMILGKAVSSDQLFERRHLDCWHSAIGVWYLSMCRLDSCSISHPGA